MSPDKPIIIKDIALFGTSADPPTAAHQIILQWLSQHYDLVAVWASDNPFKEHQASLAQRMEMLRLLITEMDSGQKNVSVYEELSHSRSLMTLQRAKQLWGEDIQYSLVIGSDLVTQIHSWYHAQELLQQLHLLIMPRPSYPIKEKELAKLRQLGGNVTVADLDTPPVSSTAYREQKHQNNIISVITPAIQNYIKKEQLYQ